MSRALPVEAARGKEWWTCALTFPHFYYLCSSCRLAEMKPSIFPCPPVLFDMQLYDVFRRICLIGYYHGRMSIHFFALLTRLLALRLLWAIVASGKRRIRAMAIIERRNQAFTLEI